MPAPEIEYLEQQLHHLRMAIAETNVRLQKITENVKAMNFKWPELADLGYLQKGLEDLCNDARKTFGAHKAETEKVLCAAVSARCVADPTASDKVVGHLATAKPNIAIDAALPKVGTPEYEELCRFFGCPEDGIFRPHFPAMGKEVTRRREEGLPLPPGLGKTYTRFYCSYRARGQKDG